jgi:ABC-2 type transport system permease protein
MKALSIAYKDLQIFFKDRGAVIVLVLLPLLFVVVLSGALGSIGQSQEKDTRTPLPAVNLDGGAMAQTLLDGIDKAGGVRVEPYTEADAATALDDAAVPFVLTIPQGFTADVDAAEEQVAKGEATAAILIPANFSSHIGDHIPTAINVVVDPGEPQSASIVTGIMNQVVAEVTIWGEVQYGIRSLLEGSGVLEGLTPVEQEAVGAQTLGVIMTALNEMRRTPAIAVESENLEAGEDAASWLPTFFAYLFPGFTVMFIFINASWSSQSLLAERESGTLRRLLAAPLPRGTVIIGKMLAFLLLSCMQVVVMFTSASIFFDMPLGQSPLALVVVTLVVALTSTSMGMLVAALSKSASKANNAGIIVGMVMSAVGGAIGARAPLTRAGGFAGILASLTPQGHAVNAYYSVMAENATLVQVLPSLGIVLAMCLVFYIIAVWRFKFEV